MVENVRGNPVNRLPHWSTTLPLAQSCPRCGAKNRAGNPCQSPAMRGKARCRLHGGASTGPRTIEGLARIRAARTIHGNYSAAAAETRAQMREILQELRALDQLLP